MTDALLDGFARDFPGDFAAVLGRHGFDEGAEVLRRLPDADVLAVLAMLPGGQLRRVQEAFGDAEMARLVAIAPFELAAALLHRLPAPRRSAILAVLPERRRRLELQRRLAWPEGSLGALASRSYVAVPAAATLHDLIGELRDHPAEGDEEPEIYVLDDGGRLRGMLDLRRTLELPDRDVPVVRCLLPHEGLPADMPASVALDLPVWRRLGAVAVVDREQRLIGSVTLAAVRDAAHVTVDADASFEIITDLALRFLETLGQLVTLVFGGAAPERRPGGRPPPGRPES